MAPQRIRRCSLKSMRSAGGGEGVEKTKGSYMRAACPATGWAAATVRHMVQRRDRRHPGVTDDRRSRGGQDVHRDEERKGLGARAGATKDIGSFLLKTLLALGIGLATAALL